MFELWNNWKEILDGLNIDETFLTKENFEVIKSNVTIKDYNIQHNIKTYIQNLSTQADEMNKFLQFLVIRKIGNTQIQAKKIKLDAQLKQQENYKEMVNQHLISLEGIVENFSSTPWVDVKQAVISLILETQLIVLLDNMTGIREDLNDIIAENPFCINPCP